MTEKTPNYTPEQVEQLVQGYKSGMAVEQLALDLGKSVRSIVAKLSREGVYQPKTSKAGVVRVTKADMVEQIAKLCGKSSEVMESLEKANQDVLLLLVKQLRAE